MASMRTVRGAVWGMHRIAWGRGHTRPGRTGCPSRPVRFRRMLPERKPVMSDDNPKLK